jgi:ParB family chromosome partitioning protein
MSARQRGLGRGLGALIAPPEARPGPIRDGGATSPTDVFFNGPSVSVSGGAVPPQPEVPAGAGGDARAMDAQRGQVVGELRLVQVSAIVPNPRQPRQEFDEVALEELAASIREVGILQPVVLRAVGSGRYELIMGERRWRAAQLAGVTEIPAVIRSTADDDLLRDALLENLHRSELNPLEEGAAYAQLLNDFSCTHEELAGRIGRSRSHITNTMRLLGLPPAVQRRVAAGVLSAGHARALLSLDDAAAQETLASRIVAEGLSVRAAEELVAVREPARRSTPRRATAPAELDEVAAALSERLDTRVKVAMGRNRGRITVEFAGLDDLQRIVTALAPAPVAEVG